MHTNDMRDMFAMAALSGLLSDSVNIAGFEAAAHNARTGLSVCWCGNAKARAYGARRPGAFAGTTGGGGRRGLNMSSWREIDEAPVAAFEIAPAAPKVKRVTAGAPVHMELSRRAGSAP